MIRRAAPGHLACGPGGATRSGWTDVATVLHDRAYLHAGVGRQAGKAAGGVWQIDDVVQFGRRRTEAGRWGSGGAHVILDITGYYV